ncbi:tRNA-dihydrouridine(16/17) synthase [NAD(P)(+)]-like (tRNA-dihydrouridine synthase 1-like) [Durusdinium trenchii]|uniref:tRNA-dihydrouridine(16/17) synthase [NAD(P)(+)]-like (tRNA-dihydrouridine synthase 1-like) n=1 Tax=Durusdinium trenchii TaxID=1381693 RepID=A0ABP0HTA6_9DINO
MSGHSVTCQGLEHGQQGNIGAVRECLFGADTLNLASRLEAAGASVLCLHGRTKEMKGQFTGPCDWEAIAAVRKRVNIPLIANGGIQTFQDVERCLAATGANAVMSSEALLEYPALFSNDTRCIYQDELALEYLELAKLYQTPHKQIKAHMFHFLYAGLQLHTDLRSRFGEAKGWEQINDTALAFQERRRRDRETGVAWPDKGWYLCRACHWARSEKPRVRELRPPQNLQKETTLRRARTLKSMRNPLDPSGTTIGYYWYRGCIQHCHYCINSNGPDECGQLKCAAYCAKRDNDVCLTNYKVFVDLDSDVIAALSMKFGIKSVHVQSVYAQHSFLPPAKRAKFDPAAPAEVILRARFLQPHEPVPTVCAAYGFQHLLPRHLLEQKGIFATLKDGDAGPEFLDPALLAAMLGLFEPAVLSNQLQLLYRQIGNSIATPHALMALLAGLDYLFQWGLDVNGAINKVWQRRIVGQKAIIIEQREFYILAGLDPIIEQITVRSDLVTNDSHVTLHCRHVNGRSAYLTVKLAWTVSDLLKCFTWKFDISAHVYIAATGEKLFPSQTVGQIFEQYHEWTLFVRTFPIASLSICKDYDTCVPTQAWHGPQPLCDAIHDQPADPFRLKPVGDDDLFADTQFQFALSLLESNCLQASSLSATTFTVTFGTTPCTLTFNGFGDSEARLRCIRGLWDHLDQDTQLFAFKICEHGDLSRLPPHGVIFPKFTEDRLVIRY